jgi:hypothetical protein
LFKFLIAVEPQEDVVNLLWRQLVVFLSLTDEEVLLLLYVLDGLLKQLETELTVNAEEMG